MSKNMRARKCAPALIAALAVLAVALVTVPVASYAAEGASSDMSDDFSHAGDAYQQTSAEEHTDGRLTSFQIANGDLALRGISAYQIVINPTNLEWQTNPGAQYEVTDVTVSDERVATAYKWTSAYGDVWSLTPGYVGGTATVTATAVDKTDPNNILTTTATVTCTPGEGWVPASDLVLGQNGVVRVSLGWADQGGYMPLTMSQLRAICSDDDLHFTIADPSIAKVVDGTRVVPLKAGTTTISMSIDDLFYGKTTTLTAQLVVTDGAATTTVANEQGATLTHTVTDKNGFVEDEAWRSLTLVTNWLGGDEAQDAVDSVAVAIAGVTGHPYVYDLHLLDVFGDVFQIPEGESATVTLPIPEGLSADGLRVFHVADDGTVTDMSATVDAEAGTVSFTTTHFSTFVLANVKTDDGGAGGGSDTKQASAEKAADKLAATGDAGSAAALLTAASGSMALLGSRVIRKRH